MYTHTYIRARTHASRVTYMHAQIGPMWRHILDYAYTRAYKYIRADRIYLYIYCIWYVPVHRSVLLSLLLLCPSQGPRFELCKFQLRFVFSITLFSLFFLILFLFFFLFFGFLYVCFAFFFSSFCTELRAERKLFCFLLGFFLFLYVKLT